MHYKIYSAIQNERTICRRTFYCFYLSPADYHRIHSPIDGEVLRQYTLGQKSYPVNQLGLTYGKTNFP